MLMQISDLADLYYMFIPLSITYKDGLFKLRNANKFL